MNMSGDGHAAALRLGGRTGDGSAPRPTPPVAPKPTRRRQARPQAPPSPQSPQSPQSPIKSAEAARDEVKRLAAMYEKLVADEAKVYRSYDKTLKPMLAEYNRTVRDINRAKSDEERLALQQRFDEIERQLRTINNERELRRRQALDRLEQERAEALRRVVHVDNPARNTISILDPTEVGNAAHWQKGMDEFNKLVSAEVWSGNQIGFMAIPDGERPFYNPSTGNVRVQTAEPLRSIVHEIGHALEVRGRLYDNVKTYYDKRTQGETPEKMGTVTGNNNYNDDELTRKDKWMNPYMGKQYASKSTEVVSMGVEYFYAEPEKLAQHDPETFDFIYNLLRGR